jgi:uncharacterized protein (TIGR02444 family)
LTVVPRLDADAFWEFSLAFYSREPVANACLSLQDRRGADVNILLLCCWLATLECGLDGAALRRADAAVADWRREVILPLRAARHAASDRFPELGKFDRRSIKQAILSAELECERIAQRKLVEAVAEGAESAAGDSVRSRALGMLGDYLSLMGGTPESQDHEDIRAILDQL